MLLIVPGEIFLGFDGWSFGIFAHNPKEILQVHTPPSSNLSSFSSSSYKVGKKAVKIQAQHQNMIFTTYPLQL